MPRVILNGTGCHFDHEWAEGCSHFNGIDGTCADGSTMTGTFPLQAGTTHSSADTVKQSRQSSRWSSLGDLPYSCRWGHQTLQCSSPLDGRNEWYFPDRRQQKEYISAGLDPGTLVYSMDQLAFIHPPIFESCYVLLHDEYSFDVLLCPLKGLSGLSFLTIANMLACSTKADEWPVFDGWKLLGHLFVYIYLTTMLVPAMQTTQWMGFWTRFKTRFCSPHDRAARPLWPIQRLMVLWWGAISKG